jgi:hypothetical protein
MARALSIQWGTPTLMPYRSNAAEAWYPEPEAAEGPAEITLDLLPPRSLTEPLWRSLAANLRYSFAPPELPPLQLQSRPVDVGLLLGDRISLPWFRTIFTNIGDVVSPETLPPLELESRPVDVGELITDQLSHFWWSSLLRNLADRVAPEKMPALDLTAKPVADVIPKGWLLLPLWSDVISTPKVFYADKPAAETAARLPAPKPAAPPSEVREVPADPIAADLIRDIRRSRIRKRIWICLATAQAIYLIVMVFWPSLL